MLQMSMRDSPLTISVMMNSTRPIPWMERVQVEFVGRFRKLIGQHRRHRVPRREKRRRHLRVVPDHHRHSHGFAESTAETEHDGANDAGPGEKERGANRFEARGPEGVGASR